MHTMKAIPLIPRIVCLWLALGLMMPLARAFDIVQYNHPGLKADLGVGLWAWPVPLDYDQDGDFDLIVSCPDMPHNGTFFFENIVGNVAQPLFKPGVRIGKGVKNLQVSHVNGKPRVMVANKELVGLLKGDLNETRIVHPVEKMMGNEGKDRFNVWSFVDYNGDGLQDIMVGTDDWNDFGWDDGYDDKGNWKRGKLHGYVYILLNNGTDEQPAYKEPFRVQADGADLDVYGNPMPNMADFDLDGDLDLICAEFLDGFTFFENVGTRKEPRFAKGAYLKHGGDKIRMHVQMITPSAIDWDQDGDVDLICGDEDGRVAFIENTGGMMDGVPLFQHPVYFQQEAKDLKFGALVTPVSFDWDSDGDEDLICGNTSGNIAWIENLDGGSPPKWALPKLLKANDRLIHLQAGSNGSIQGPAEAKWGYTTLTVADWNHDGRHDLIVNSIWGKVLWYPNIGSKTEPELAEAMPVLVEWPDNPPKPAWTWWTPRHGELVTQWRTTPVVVDWNEDGWNDLLILDHEGHLALFERRKEGNQLYVMPGKRIFSGGVFDSKNKQQGEDTFSLQLNNRTNGGSGRRKLCVVDWDSDGRLDLLVNSTNVDWLRNTGMKHGNVHFENMGPLSKQQLAGHTTSPTTVDWDGDGVRELLVGAEDGRFYYLDR